MTIFVDTSFWVVNQNRRDDRHAEAGVLLEKFSGEPFITSNHVRGETWTFLRRRAGHPAAIDYLDLVEHSPRVTVFTVPPAMEEAALLWLRRRDERSYSFVDATSFAVMWHLRLGRVLAFDEDFTAAGFQVLRA